MCDDGHGKGVTMYLGNVGQADATVRSMTASQWTAGNYTLRAGELGIETDTGKQKAGVGKTWADTSYFTPTGYTGTLTAVDESTNIGTLTFANGVLVSYVVS